MAAADTESSPASPLTSTRADRKYASTARTSRPSPPSASSSLSSSATFTSPDNDDADDDVPDLKQELLPAVDPHNADGGAGGLPAYHTAYSRSPSLFSRLIQISKISFTIFLVVSSSLSITTTQLIGYPLYYVSKDWYRAWMDWTKQLFGILLTFNTQFNTPLCMYMTGNKTVQGLFAKDPTTGHLETRIGDRAIVISNHQLYTDWVYLWWFSLTAKAHGSVYIMLKKSLAKIPVWGWGMKNYRFFFLSRSWAQDEKILTDGLNKINEEKQYPAWVLLFPEGTTISANGVRKTVEYSKKFNPPLDVPKHVLIPRARGLRFSIEKLHQSVEHVYDATIYYEGIPDAHFGEDFYSMKTMFLDRLYPRKIHVYWRAYKVVDIPWQDEAKFEQWLQARWQEKDDLLDTFRRTGRFQPVPSVAPAHVTRGDTDGAKVEEGPSEVLPAIVAPVELDSLREVLKIFMVPVTFGLLARLGYKAVVAFVSWSSNK